MEKLTGLNKLKTAVFISGTGSNFKNLIKFSKIKKAPILISLVISNDRKAKGLKYADQFNIKKRIFDFNNIKNTEKTILTLLKKKKNKFYLFGRIYENFIQNFYKKI